MDITLVKIYANQEDLWPWNIVLLFFPLCEKCKFSTSFDEYLYIITFWKVHKLNQLEEL